MAQNSRVLVDFSRPAVCWSHIIPGASRCWILSERSEASHDVRQAQIRAVVFAQSSSLQQQQIVPTHFRAVLRQRWRKSSSQSEEANTGARMKEEKEDLLPPFQVKPVRQRRQSVS
ncbi:hypothetical protein NQZ68_022855 [Dissostichus eleginoides]|nr:hypothetical protein NQZ68_022855 [Dissostichus eleginoides]